MNKYPIGIFWIAETNFALWSISLGSTVMSFFNDTEISFINKGSMGIAGVGMILAALFQHWAYHNVYKPSRRDKNK